MTESPAFGKPPSGRYFIKMHGLENHFVIVDGRDEPYRPERDEIIRICDLQTGVGGDQLVVIESPRREAAAAFMRILNVDGREVEACGNATRCVAWLLMEERDSAEVVVETLAGPIRCRKTGDLEVSCEMGRVNTGWRSIPLSRDVDTAHIDMSVGPLDDGIALNIGNPHIVFFVDDIDAVDLELFAPAVQRHGLFPEGVNVGVAELVSEDRLRSKVYERGAGLTAACGSGACVAAFGALARGMTDARRLTVSMRAGDVTIDISAEGVATMTGPVAFCFSGYLPPG